MNYVIIPVIFSCISCLQNGIKVLFKYVKGEKDIKSTETIRNKRLKEYTEESMIEKNKSLLSSQFI